MSTHAPRSALQVTLSVWNALFLREALARLFKSRGAWFWVMFEPLFHIGYLLVIYSVIRIRVIGGIDVVTWLTIGFLCYFTFQRTYDQVTRAIRDNKGLLSYRQVKPIDTIIARAGLEAFLMVGLVTAMALVAMLWGRPLWPGDPIVMIVAFFGLWLTGLGCGLVAAVIVELVQEGQVFLSILMRPLYFISGVIFPLTALQPPYREWLMYNPVANGVEVARAAFAPFYHAVPEASLAYLYGFGLVSLFLGLALHRRFARKLLAL